MKTIIMDGLLYENYNLELIFRDALYNQLELTDTLTNYLQEQYQITKDTQLAFIGMWLGKSYNEDYLRVRNGLETFRVDGFTPTRQVICLPMQKLVLCALFPMIDRRKYYYFQSKVQNEFRLFAPESSVFVVERCTGILEGSTVLDTIMSQLDWNLVMGPRVLINYNRIKELHITPLKYPTELDGEIEKILLQKDFYQFGLCFKKLWDFCHLEIHSPESLKAIYIRYALVIAHVCRINGYEHNEIKLQHMITTIVNAVYWTDIWEVVLAFSMDMLAKDEKDKAQSLLVIETRKLIQRYYGTGIVLEEIADKLHVTEEYLSTVFKRETGITFSETIRTYRINKVKELLTTSKLKINEIAIIAGYSDGKYMSRVFKEVVGMSPNEYRKTHAD